MLFSMISFAIALFFTIFWYFCQIFFMVLYMLCTLIVNVIYYVLALHWYKSEQKINLNEREKIREEKETANPWWWRTWRKDY